MSVALNPIITNRNSSRESDGYSEIAKLKPSVGIEPEQAPKDDVDPSQRDRSPTQAKKPVGDRDLGWLGWHPGGLA